MAFDENGNWVDDPPPDDQQPDPGAPNPGADTTSQGAPQPDFATQSISDPSRGPAEQNPIFASAPPPTNWSTGGTWQPGQPTSTDPTGSIGMAALGPAPGSPGGAQAPSAPTPGSPPTSGSTQQQATQQGFKFPDYSGAFQKQLEMNDAWNKRLFEFEQQKYTQDYALRQSQFGLDQEKFGESKAQFQKDFDLRSAAQKADQAYKEALIQTGNIQLAQQAMRDSMTRDFQNQELGFRNRQAAQTTDIEREKLDIQRRLLPVTRTARRAATVATF